MFDPIILSSLFLIIAHVCAAQAYFRFGTFQPARLAMVRIVGYKPNMTVSITITKL
jgi:hypothetical protein